MPVMSVDSESHFFEAFDPDPACRVLTRLSKIHTTNLITGCSGLPQRSSNDQAEEGEEKTQEQT